LKRPIAVVAELGESSLPVRDLIAHIEGDYTVFRKHSYKAMLRGCKAASTAMVGAAAVGSRADQSDPNITDTTDVVPDVTIDMSQQALF